MELKLISSLCSCLEEHICLNAGFANLEECVTFRDALRLLNRKTLPIIEKWMEEYLKNYDNPVSSAQMK